MNKRKREQDKEEYDHKEEIKQILEKERASKAPRPAGDDHVNKLYRNRH